MRRVLTEIAAILLLIAVKGSAEEVSKVAVGAKMWLNKWTQHAPGAQSITSDDTLLLGPAIETECGSHIIMEASYVFSISDYTFSNPNVVNNGRQDVELVFAYMLVPKFDVVAGYKNMVIYRKEAGIKETIAGPLAGIRGNIPVDDNLSFYTGLNYLVTRFKQAGATTPGVTSEEDIPGWTFEFGIKYDYARRLTGTLGYKYETYTGKDSRVEDTFTGLTFAGMVAF